ncbi:SIR2 family protein [Flavipsychrobacter stenotrophus]|uniref:SIR2 family protein n=1 Tax=Flavipsychrobacter stenotrophus TaxID=2077091 RepID=A0A2S7T055_9BACT|nr:SIR2 family protein [Flavipsychrobacter stenotrophus]PQJ12318.1 SIR2 family protein [Flavipsychrobacter stenotrophus]
MNAIVPKGKQMLLWDSLGKKLGEYLPDYQYSNALDAISAYGHEFSRNKLIEKLANVLLVDQIKPGEAHKAFAKLPFKLIVTTNFDFLLEQSYSYCKPILDESQLSISVNDNSVSILKIHGDLHHPNKLVATEEDYDLFIEKNPLFSTFLANQLITKTPLFIGYSIDDPDLRQIFKVVNERLGNSKRPAYTIKLNSTHHEISKFERRGIKVINIIDKELSYSRLFELIFTELESYWQNEILKTGTFTQEESQSEILVKDDSKNRLCFFSIPFQLLSFYKQNLFPIAESYGFVPITADEVLTSGDTILAKISALIDKAEILVMDISSQNNNVMLELGMATAKGNSKKILVFKDEDDQIPSDLGGITYINKPNDIFTDYEGFFNEVENWFRDIAEVYREYFENEPSRLLNKNEYRAAIVSAISLLEKTLRSKISINETQYKYRAIPLFQIVRIAVEQNIVDKKDYITLRQGLEIRNTIVHSTTAISITKDKAKKIVDSVNKIVKSLRQ